MPAHALDLLSRLGVDGLDIESEGVSQGLHGLVLLFDFSFEGEDVGAVFVIFFVGVGQVCDGDGELFEGGELVLGEVSEFGEAEGAEEA